MCQNCKNAGTEHGACEFLRVRNCWLTTIYQQRANHPKQVNSTVASIASSWSYPHPAIEHGSPISRDGSSLGQYPPPQAPSSFQGSSLAAASLPASVHSVHGLSGASYPYGPSRQSFPSSYGHNFSDEIFQNYSLAHESHLPSLGYGAPDTSRQWAPVSAEVRQTHQNFPVDHESSNRYSQVAYSQSQNAIPADASGAVDRSGMFPRMSTLESHLPSLIPRKSRALPVPESKRPSVGHNTNAATGVTDPNPPLGIPPSLSYRSSIHWTTEGSAMETTEASNSSTSSSMSNRDPTAGHSSSSPQATHRSAAFDLRPMPSTSSGQGSYYAPSSMATLSSNIDSESASYLSRFPKSHKVGYQHAEPSHYGYSLGSDMRNDANDPMISEGTLVNGQQYTRLHEADHSRSYEDLALPQEGNSQASHRISISSISNRRPY